MTETASSPETLARAIADAVAALPPASNRQLVAIAGAPGAGKSTVSELTRKELASRGIPAGLIYMDGFHLDNAILSERNLIERKGAPETFDVAGFHALVLRLRSEGEVAVPEFDRQLDVSISARSMITEDQRVVLVEGNYLLLDEPGWSDLNDLWSLKIFLDVDLQTLEARLTDRWLSFGLPLEAAKARALSNDIPNAKRVLQNSSPGDLVLT